MSVTKLNKLILKISGSEIIAFCNERLANYKVPKIVEIRESLPKTSGKDSAKRTETFLRNKMNFEENREVSEKEIVKFELNS